ncbi:oligosaccharide flippase family protein [Salinigranum halophilum]|uniref:oligosaccharide flippase family protein n=1 Tax=Salinigranum halophilum TaxID=2565931 RepID=UPI0010A902B3|nr:polysaccharide biosynthesis C-terminal domain-containing protein [Salinigranum halophilum]
MGLPEKVLSDSFFSSVRVIISALRGIIIIPIITNFLGADSYGTWTTIIAFVGLVTSSGGLHLHGSLIRFSQDEDMAEVYSDTLALSILIGLATAVSVTVLGLNTDVVSLLQLDSVDKVLVIIMISFVIFFNMIFEISSNFPRALGEIRLYDTILILKMTVETVGLIWVFSTGLSIFYGLIVIITVSAIANFTLFVVYNYYFSLPVPRMKRFRRYISYGLPMVPKEISSSLLANGDKYIILYFLSPTAVGIYAVARSVSVSITNFTKILNPTLYPTVSNAFDKGNIEQLSNLYENVMRFYIVFSLPTFFGIIFLSYPIALVISNNRIAMSAEVLIPVLTIGFLFRGFDDTLSYILTADQQTKIIGKITTIAVLVNIVLNLLFIQEIGLMGAAIATLASHVIISTLIYIKSYQVVEFAYPYRSFIRCLASSIIMFITLHILLDDFSAQLLILVAPLMGSVLYFTSLFVLGEFDLKIMKQLIPVDL